MKKMIHVRNGVIIILCITIICMGVGFIALSMEMKALQDKVNFYDVSFVSFTKTSTTKGGKVDPSSEVEIVGNGKELDMKFTLNAAHDEVGYTVLVKNNGTMAARIVDLLESPDYTDSSFQKNIAPVSITHSDIIDKVLEPGDEVEFRIDVYYNPSTLSGVRSFNYKLGLITEAK